ncbi:G-type lectin S-receptor-like serine/threonine-protein kinase At5g35370 [Elaeis guineensis]|uniref:G-type lectin S-receptor-like serine/threonine-protein kinase At5g35370 n=1 Tax=Elaeis guineensis var. tenera TaxID=51953 RepID=UPI003C6DB1AD
MGHLTTPEWLTNSAISDQIDMYCFEIVLPELVRGRKNKSVELSEGESRSTEQSESTGSDGNEGRYFSMVALDVYEQGRHKELADQKLEERTMVAKVKRVVKVVLCL